MPLFEELLPSIVGHFNSDQATTRVRLFAERGRQMEG
jgi:hypothetical protein